MIRGASNFEKLWANTRISPDSPGFVCLSIVFRVSCSMDVDEGLSESITHEFRDEYSGRPDRKSTDITLER